MDLKSLIIKLCKLIYCTAVSMFVSSLVLAFTSVISDEMSGFASSIVLVTSFIITFSYKYNK